MRRMLFVIGTAGVLASPAAAHMCPALAAEVGAVLATAVGLNAESRATLEAQVEEGMALHEAGDHAASEAALMQVLTLLTSAGR